MTAVSAPKAQTPPDSFFFMHIAKTAGSFVNAALERTFEGRFVDHCESEPRSPLGMDDPTSVSVWSGHIYYPRWRNIERRLGYRTRRFTILRDPYQQLASHIQWLDHYGQPQAASEYNALDPGTQEVVRQVASADIEDAGDLDRLLMQLSKRGIQYFDNCQSRYFICDFDTIKPDDPLHLGMRPRLTDAMAGFEVIGRGDDLPRFERALCAMLGTPIELGADRVNPAKSARRVPIDSEDVRMVLQRRILVDLWLYANVQ